MYTVAVDIGGTFTDVVAIDGGSGRMAMGKALTTPADLQRGVLDGLAEAAGGLGLELGALLDGAGRMVHATTQSSNAVFAFSGAKTAVLTTRGFGDTLVIMRATGRVAGLSVFERHHYRATEKPRLLVDERDIFEIAERVDHRGRVVVPLDEAALRAAARDVVSRLRASS
jgi:N-methylhydantoinase A